MRMRAWFALVPSLLLCSLAGCQRLPGDGADDDDGSPPPEVTDGGTTFVPIDDDDDDGPADGDSGDMAACDPVRQTGCTSGEKCTAIGSGSGFEYGCVSDPAGLGPADRCDPSPSDGIDGCPPGYACLADQSDAGVCAPLCRDTSDCTRAQCIPSREQDIPYCADDCSPFESSCTAPLQCRRNGDRFSCQFLGPGDTGGVGEVCSIADDTGCAPGLACLPGELVPGCEIDTCCTTLCDVTEDDACDAPSMCSPLLPGPAPTFETIGACFVPS